MTRAVHLQMVEDRAAQMRMLVFDVPASGNAARIQQTVMHAMHEAIDVQHVFEYRQRRICGFEIACTIVDHPMTQDQILSAGGRADRVGLHETEASDRRFESGR